MRRLYQYRCPACRHEFEAFADEECRSLARCPRCQAAAFKTISLEARPVLTGSGFHDTDYK